MNARDRLIVALDFPSRLPALEMVDRLGSSILWYKVGLELYLAEGAAIVHELASRGKSVFLDLKLHDIPNTVAGAVRSASGTGASLLTVHAAGGPAMLNAAAEAAASAGKMKLLAVTVLTSMDDRELSLTGISCSAEEQVNVLGTMALKHGVSGLVCSPQESAAMRAVAGPGPLLVVPGIRADGSCSDDQRRTATAAEAIRNGASSVVIGRPITQADDPGLAAEVFLREIAGATTVLA